MEPLGIHHVSLNVSDVDEGVSFYAGLLGGTVRTDRPDFGVGGAWIDLGTQQVHLIEATVPPNLGQHVALLVADLDAVIGELRGKGLHVPAAATVGGDRQTFIEDPFGNLVELHEAGVAR